MHQRYKKHEMGCTSPPLTWLLIVLIGEKYLCLPLIKIIVCMGKKNVKQKVVKKAAVQKHPVKKTPQSSALTRQQLLLLLALIVAVFIAYFPALNKDFINYDDDLYIVNNPLINAFSFSKLPQIFGKFMEAQYSPIPTVLYGIVYMLGGGKPFLFNFVGVLLHLTSILLVFQFIRALNKNFRVAFITAALFGLCTMQVESVAWLAAVYKTGTYSIFFISSLIMYVKYIDLKKMKYLWISLLLFFLSCFCKEQAVALSLAVIVIDLYYRRKIFSKQVLIEKIPYLLISVALGLLTIAATKSNKEIYFESSFSIVDRIIYAGYALSMYLAKMIVPFRLSLFYPYPGLKSGLSIYLIYPVIILLLTAFTCWVVIKKKSGFVLFGSLFFLVNILFSLALQVISVREVVMADRYVYLASIGVFFIIAKGADILIEKNILKFQVVAAILGVFMLITGVFTFNRTTVWKNSETVMTDAINKFSFPLAYVNRGVYYRKLGSAHLNALQDSLSKRLISPDEWTRASNNVRQKYFGDALSDYTNAIAVKPDYALAYHNRGTIYFYSQMDDSAYANYTKALKFDPKNPETWSNRGASLARRGKFQLALIDLDSAIRLDPTKKDSYLNRALTFESLTDYQKAIADYDSYLKLDPRDASIYNNRGVAKQHMQQFKESLDDFNTAINIDPQANYYLSRSYSWNALGDKAKALADVQVAARSGAQIDPAYLTLLQQ
jgi:protein O-mannosyl-transferase